MAERLEKHCVEAQLPCAGSGLEEIASLHHGFARRVNELAKQLTDQYQRRPSARDVPACLHAMTRRADEAFRLACGCDVLLERLEHVPGSRRRSRLRKDIKLTRNRALRYNRESLLSIEHGPIAVIPLEYSRTFLRDGCERMYFLSLHNLPSAYDFFCTTYVEAPRGYRQEGHLHRNSSELTLILDGESDCVWYSEGPRGGGATVELGRRTGRELEAFRIPCRVPHYIHNPNHATRNLTVKLSPFIADRVGERHWSFPAEPKNEGDVTVDRGNRTVTPWGMAIRYAHGFRDVRFDYRVDAVSPGRRFIVSRNVDTYFFLFRGSTRLISAQAGASLLAGANSILRVAATVEAVVENIGEDDVLLFAVAGLDCQHFLAHPRTYPCFPKWLIADIRRTMRRA